MSFLKWMIGYLKLEREFITQEADHGSRFFGEYGFTFNSNKIYCHVYEGYRELKSGKFTTQSLGNKRVTKVKNLYNEKDLSWVKNKNNTITISGVDYSLNPSTTILEITLNESVYK